MRPASRHYLLIVLAPLAVLASGSVLLNVWIDPLDTLRYQRLTTRTYTLPALLAELEHPAAAESDTEVLMLGTSRTRQGHDTREVPGCLNLGVDGADDRMIDNLLVGLLQNSTRPHVYFVDTMGGRGDPWGELEDQPLRYLFSGATTKLSLRQIADELRKRPLPDAASNSGNIAPKEPTKADRESDQKIVEYLRRTLPVRPETQPEIERRIRQIRELPVPQHALVVFYDGPHSPPSLSDEVVTDALRARAHLWQKAAANPNPPVAQPAEARRPGVTVAYVSFATPAEWGEPAAPEVWTEGNWLDALHFNPTVGQRLLDRLMKFAAEYQSSTAVP